MTTEKVLSSVTMPARDRANVSRDAPPWRPPEAVGPYIAAG